MVDMDLSNKLPKLPRGYYWHITRQDQSGGWRFLHLMKKRWWWGSDTRIGHVFILESEANDVDKIVEYAYTIRKQRIPAPEDIAEDPIAGDYVTEEPNG
jgi:hypothetical protein